MLDSGRAALCHRFCSSFLWISRRSQGLEGSGSGATGFHLCFLHMMLSCWLLRARTSSMTWGGLQPNVKLLGWESAPLSPRPWLSTGKSWPAPSELGEGSCLKDTQDTLEELEEVWEGSLGVPTQTAAPAPWPRLKRKKMDGWHYNKQTYLPNTLNTDNAFKIKTKPYVVINILYVSINIMYWCVNDP